MGAYVRYEFCKKCGRVLGTVTQYFGLCTYCANKTDVVLKIATPTYGRKKSGTR